MTNAELLAKIKVEIERRIADNAFGAKLELIDILAWLDTLESEKPMNQEGLEEEIHEYNKERFDEYFPEQDGDFISEVDFMTCLNRVARHFAQWGAEHAKNSDEKPVPKDLEEAANKFAVFYDQGTCDGIAQDCFIAGAEWQKEQMMKEAVEGEVRKDGTIGYFEFSNEQQFHSLLEQFQDCDKVRIVIVKEDEK